MGKQEETKSCLPEKPPSPPCLDQTNMHVYPDWNAAQAYYGPRVPVPVPYYGSSVPPGYAPHPYMWGPPQRMIPPPYGTPYAAAYPHGGVYAHPAVPLAPTPVSVETPTKSSGDGSTKKLKSVDGFVISTSNENSDTAENEAKQRSSESTETEGASDGSSDDNNMGVDQNRRKRSHGGTPLVGGGKAEGGISSDGATAQPLAVGHPKMQSEHWMVNEKELKREKRKQSNRESARRSRLRKQAEAEELANRVGALSAENMALTSDISQLTEDSKRLKRENALLMEKLKNSKVNETKEKELNANPDHDNGNGRSLHVTTKNLISRVNNSGTVGIISSEEDEERNTKGGGNSNKLKQLMDTKPISNKAVRAS